MSKYQTGKIYKIVNTITNDVYVGSTICTLKKRFNEHKSSAYRGTCNHLKLYKLIEDVGIDNFKIELIEHFPCDNHFDLVRREGYYIYTLNASLNTFIAGRTYQEWKGVNPDSSKASAKRFYEKHKEDIRARARVSFNCECGGTYCTDTKLRHCKSLKHLTYIQERTT